MDNKKCIYCKTEILGQYCHACGEKLVSPKDFTLLKFTEQTVEIFTHLDSKLYKTVKYLLFRPGHLSTCYMEGLRKPFMKPFQIFILVNILFFIFLSNIDVFRKPSYWWFNVTADMGYNIKSIAEKKATEISKPLSEVALLYDQKSKSVAKAFVITFIPLLGLYYCVLFIRSKKQIGLHIIFATHLFSFILLIMVAWTELINLFFNNPTSAYYVIPFQLILFIYMTLAIRQFYKTSWLFTLLATLIGLFVFNICIEIYRFAVSMYSLSSIH